MGGRSALRSVWPAALGRRRVLRGHAVPRVDLSSARSSPTSSARSPRWSVSWCCCDCGSPAGAAPSAAVVEPLSAPHGPARLVPYLLLVVFVLLWGFAPFKRLLDLATFVVPWPGLHEQIVRQPPVVGIRLTLRRAVHRQPRCRLRARACDVRDACCGASRCGLSPWALARSIGRTARTLAFSMLTIASRARARVRDELLGATRRRSAWPSRRPARCSRSSARFLGWLGVFLTGSDTSANALFGNLQVVTAQHARLRPELMAASNSAGGVMGKMISLQSIAVAVAATGMASADEARAVPLHAEAQRAARRGHGSAGELLFLADAMICLPDPDPGDSRAACRRSCASCAALVAGGERHRRDRARSPPTRPTR